VEGKYLELIPGWELIHPPLRKLHIGALVGTDVSDKIQKTVHVDIEHYRIAPKYKTCTKKFICHDEEEASNLGYLIMIVSCRKLSKIKKIMFKKLQKPRTSRRICHQNNMFGDNNSKEKSPQSLRKHGLNLELRYRLNVVRYV